MFIGIFIISKPIFAKSMKKLLVIVLLCFSYVLFASETDEFTHIHCEGYTRTQIFEKILDVMSITYNAEFAYNDTSMVLAYVIYRPENCVGVIYTVKFFITDEEYSFAIYSAVTRKDDTDECRQDVVDGMKEVRKRVKAIL